MDSPVSAVFEGSAAPSSVSPPSSPMCLGSSYLDFLLPSSPSSSFPSTQLFSDSSPFFADNSPTDINDDTLIHPLELADRIPETPPPVDGQGNSPPPLSLLSLLPSSPPPLELSLPSSVDVPADSDGERSRILNPPRLHPLATSYRPPIRYHSEHRKGTAYLLCTASSFARHRKCAVFYLYFPNIPNVSGYYRACDYEYTDFLDQSLDFRSLMTVMDKSTHVLYAWDNSDYIRFVDIAGFHSARMNHCRIPEKDFDPNKYNTVKSICCTSKIGLGDLHRMWTARTEVYKVNHLASLCDDKRFK